MVRKMKVRMGVTVMILNENSEIFEISEAVNKGKSRLIAYLTKALLSIHIYHQPFLFVQGVYLRIWNNVLLLPQLS